MNLPSLPDELRRFLHSIPSISHLEAILLLRQDPSHLWHPASLASRLYTSAEVAEGIFKDLEDIGIAKRGLSDPLCFAFDLANQDLTALVHQLANYYANHLIEVTNLIHSRANQTPRVQQFADAFKFQKKDK